VSTGLLKQLLENPANRLSFVTGVVCSFLLLLWLVLIVASPEPIVLPPPTASGADAIAGTQLGAALDTPSLAEYESVIERPLFNETRLPSEDEDADAEDEEAVGGSTEIPPMQLAGVVLTGEHQIAMLMREGGRPLRVEVGMDVEGWVLEGLEPRRAILSNGINSVELELPLYTAPATRKRPVQSGDQSQPPGQRGRGRGRSQQGGASNQSSGQTGQAMNVRERIQQAREERERMRQQGQQSQSKSKGQDGKQGRGQGRGSQGKRPGG